MSFTELLKKMDEKSAENADYTEYTHLKYVIIKIKK